MLALHKATRLTKITKHMYPPRKLIISPKTIGFLMEVSPQHTEGGSLPGIELALSSAPDVQAAVAAFLESPEGFVKATLQGSPRREYYCTSEQSAVLAREDAREAVEAVKEAGAALDGVARAAALASGIEAVKDLLRTSCPVKPPARRPRENSRSRKRK